MLQFVSCIVTLPLAVFLLEMLGLEGAILTKNYVNAAIGGAVLGIIHITIRPIIKVLLKVFNWLTLGLLFVLIDAGLVMLCSWLVPQYFEVPSFIWAVVIALMINLVRTVLKFIFK